MEKNIKETAQKLAEAFVRFSRLNWYQYPNCLKPSELVVLNLIKKDNNIDDSGIKVSDISALLNVTTPTITQVIQSLERKGLIQRETDKDDRRAVRIKLTGLGEKVLAEEDRTFYGYFNGLIQYLGEDKSKQLADLLADVFAYFKEKQK